MRLRVLLVDQDDQRAAEVEEVLQKAGCTVVRRVDSSVELVRGVEACEPDLIIIEQASPSRDTLEGMRHLSDHNPRPIVMFVDDEGVDMIRSAVRAGVAGYVVKGLDSARVRPVLDVAIARFEEHQRLRGELREARRVLEERKVVERAKGRLMEKLQVDEEEAYRLLRQLAMDRNVRMSELAERVLDHAEVL